MSDNKPAVQIMHLTKRYGTVTAVDDLCLEVPAGRLFGFLGPNGAGKSTTIGCLTGLLDPSAGSIRLLQEELSADSVDLKRRIGVMPEGLALFDQLNAREFLAFNGRIFGLGNKTTQQRVTELMDAMDLTAVMSVRLADLSSGMRRKVAFAVAIIHGPELLFLDEPFAGLDAATVSMLKNWLRRYVARGNTVFMTSHILESVERLCDDAAIIRNGRLAWRGELRQAGAAGFEVGGHRFGSLEELFLFIVGEQQAQLDWF
jgi:ABC-2 type transport system ATP-binding protein